MAQILVPTSDQAVGLWTTTPLWSKVDDNSTLNPTGDGTVITSDNNTSPDNADLKLSSGTDPASSVGHVLRARWNKGASGGHVINAGARLYQGIPGIGTLIATLSVSAIADVEVGSTYTLSAAEANAITDYAGLYLRVSRQGDTGGNPGNRRSLVVDLVEFEIPDAGATQHSASVAVSGLGAVSAAGVIESLAVVATSSVGGLGANGVRETFATATVSAIGGVTPSVSVSRLCSVSGNAVGGILVAVTRSTEAQVSTQSAASVNAQATREAVISVPVSGLAALNLSVLRGTLAGVGVGGTGDLAAATQSEVFTVVGIGALGGLTVAVAGGQSHVASTAVSAQGGLGMSAVRASIAGVSLPALSVVSVVATRSAVASVSIPASSALAVGPIYEGSAAVVVLASSQISVGIGGIEHLVMVSLGGVGRVSITPKEYVGVPTRPHRDRIIVRSWDRARTRQKPERVR